MSLNISRTIDACSFVDLWKNHFSELCRIHTSVLLVSLSSRIECQRVNLGVNRHLWDWDREDLHQLQSMGTFPWKDENTHHMQGLTTLENYTAHSSANEASLISSSHAAGYWRRFVPGVGLHPTLIDPHPLPLNLTDQASTRPMPRYFYPQTDTRRKAVEE